MNKNQKAEVLNTKIIHIAAIISAIMMGTALITVAFRMDTVIGAICSIIAFISLIIVLLEMWKFERQKDTTNAIIIIGCVIVTILISLFVLILFLKKSF